MQQTHSVRSTGLPAPLKSNLTVAGEKKVYPRDSVRLFESDFLEKFTHVHPAVPLILWVPIIGLLIYRSFAVHESSLLDFLGYGFLALFLWTFVEYALHRFAFHYPAKSALGNRLIYLMHGLHHEDPADPTRLVMPPLPAVIYVAILAPLFRFLVGPVYFEGFLACFLIGYLAYDYTHFFTHHFTARTPIGKFLKKHHLMHHFADYDSRWGVSNPLWDYVFGTAKSKGESKDASSRAKPA